MAHAKYIVGRQPCTEFEAQREGWKDAAEFTISRIEEIRLVKEEIEWVQDCIDMSGITEPEKGIPEQRRILAREQSALAELSKGIRPEVLK